MSPRHAAAGVVLCEMNSCDGTTLLAHPSLLPVALLTILWGCSFISRYTIILKKKERQRIFIVEEGGSWDSCLKGCVELINEEELKMV